MRHPVLAWTAAALVSLVAILVLTLALLDWNVLRAPLSKFLSAKTGHPTSIDGNLSAHLWSWNPTFTVEKLTVKNPGWAERPQLLGVKKLTVQVSLKELLLAKIVLTRVEVFAPAVDFEREKSGRASWDTHSDPPTPASASPHLPAVRRLVIRDGALHVVDRVRKLSFEGTLIADEQVNNPDESALQLRCQGTLNGRAFKLQAHGGPLINVDPDKPYTFAVDVTAGDMALNLQASIPKPFDLAAYDAKFVLSGEDLADAFYLTNLALPNTAKYRLTGTLKHQDNRFQIDDFRGEVGSSDLAGKVSVTLEKTVPKLRADLNSRQLKLVDLAAPLGSRAGGGAAATAASAAGIPATHQSTWLLPDADLQVDRVRGMDADVTFKAQSVLSAKMPMKRMQFHLRLDAGVLTLDPLSFTLPQGQFAGMVRINAAGSVPESDIDMSLKDVDLSQFKAATSQSSALEGMLSGRVKLHGTGGSVHKFASSADGSVSLVIPHGQIRAVLAELTGINLSRGLGLLVTRDQQQTELRCGVAAFQAEGGKLNAKTIVMDTTNVLITGEGDVDLRNERLNIALQGKPKKIRLLRLRSPVKIAGTLSKPKVGIDPAKTILQAGAGTVLATLLTPVAAILAFVDPGLAKNADCSALASHPENAGD